MIMQLLKRYVYADAAAATPLSPSVQTELVRLLALYANPGGLHASALLAKNELAAARERAAAAIGAHADEIIFTSGGTEANNLALRGTLGRLLRERGEVQAVTTAIEHPSVLEVFAALEAEGIYAVALPVDEQGRISQEMLRESINDETALVSIQLVNSEIGTMQDLHEVVKTVRHVRKMREKENNSLPLYVHTDASQAPLWMRLNMEKLGVDLMTLDGQKILGPKGVGMLYVRRGTLLEPIVLGGGQERGLRSGTENLPLAGAFARALWEAQATCEKNAERTTRVRNFLMNEIQKTLPEAVLNGAPMSEKSRVANNCNISIPGLDGEMAVIALSTEGVAASTRSACSTTDEVPSHVLRAIGVAPTAARTALRLTLLPSATNADARHIARALKKVAARYKNVLK